MFWDFSTYFKGTALQRTNTENLKQIFTEKELRGHSPNFPIHASVSDSYIPTTNLAVLLQEICGPILGIYKSLTDEIGTEAAQFPEKEYKNGISVAVWATRRNSNIWSKINSYKYKWKALRIFKFQMLHWWNDVIDFSHAKTRKKY